MSKHSSHHPAVLACQAETVVPDVNGRPRGQCCQPAVGTRDGRPVCWLHLGAIRQLTFVRSPDDSHLTG